MKKIILAIIVVAVGAYAYLGNKDQKPTTTPTKGLTNVVVTTAQILPIRDTVEALGTAKAYESVIVTSKITDVVTSIHFDDGDLVGKGEVLVKLQDSEQQAKVALAKVKLEENQREFERISSLVTNKTVAELERDRLQSSIDAAKAELQQAQVAMTDRVIKAPFAGKLGLRLVSVGSLVSIGEQITTLDDVNKIKLDFSVPERFVQQLKPGKRVEAEAVAYPGRIFKGVVTSIDSRVNPATRAVIVRAEMPNDDYALLPGMLMKVKLIKEDRTTLLVPESAIIPVQDKHFVYSLDNQNKVIEIPVSLGLRKRGWVEITEGLSDGQQVIIRGILKVRPGDEVKVEQSENFTHKTQAEK